jgi:hypothetical protein
VRHVEFGRSGKRSAGVIQAARVRQRVAFPRAT